MAWGQGGAGSAPHAARPLCTSTRGWRCPSSAQGPASARGPSLRAAERRVVELPELPLLLHLGLHLAGAAGLGFGFLCPPQTERCERQIRKACGWHDPSPAPSTRPNKAKVKARLRGFTGFCGAAASATALNWCSGASRAGWWQRQGSGGQGTYLLVGKAIQHSHQEALWREHGPESHVRVWDWLCLTSLCFWGHPRASPTHVRINSSATITHSTGLGQEAGVPVPQPVQHRGSQLEEGALILTPWCEDAPCSRLTWKELRKRVKNTLT